MSEDEAAFSITIDYPKEWLPDWFWELPKKRQISIAKEITRELWSYAYIIAPRNRKAYRIRSK